MQAQSHHRNFLPVISRTDQGIAILRIQRDEKVGFLAGLVGSPAVVGMLLPFENGPDESGSDGPRRSRHGDFDLIKMVMQQHRARHHEAMGREFGAVIREIFVVVIHHVVLSCMGKKIFTKPDRISLRIMPAIDQTIGKVRRADKLAFAAKMGEPFGKFNDDLGRTKRAIEPGLAAKEDLHLSALFRGNA